MASPTNERATELFSLTHHPPLAASCLEEEGQGTTTWADIGSQRAGATPRAGVESATSPIVSGLRRLRRGNTRTKGLAIDRPGGGGAGASGPEASPNFLGEGSSCASPHHAGVPLSREPSVLVLMVGHLSLKLKIASRKLSQISDKSAVNCQCHETCYDRRLFYVASRTLRPRGRCCCFHTSRTSRAHTVTLKVFLTQDEFTNTIRRQSNLFSITTQGMSRHARVVAWLSVGRSN
eukprot:6192872-Pleurochrysis_carterae.AAC.5